MPVRPVNWRGGEVKFAFPPPLSVFKNGKEAVARPFLNEALGIEGQE